MTFQKALKAQKEVTNSLKPMDSVLDGGGYG